jgi:hypothetical protein
MDYFCCSLVASFACAPRDIADVVAFLSVGTSMINSQTPSSMAVSSL